jgi:hypothetical protein
MGEQLERDDWVGCCLEGWVDVDEVAQLFPNGPGGISGGCSLLGYAKGNSLVDKVQFIFNVMSHVGWTSCHEVSVGKREFLEEL